MAAVEILFWLLLVAIAYAYAGYPILIFLLSRIWGTPVRKADITPSASIIIAAYNEERDLAAKLENTLSLEYPADRLEVIVVSDCSSDKTDEIVRRYASRAVMLIRQTERLGKSAAQNLAASAASGEILVFSDATTIYKRDTLRQLVRSFADPEVGCVAGNLIYVDDPANNVNAGCRSYWGYEKFIRESESRAGSLIGVSGCLYALRRTSYARIALDMSSDFVIASEIHLQGQRTVWENEAVAIESTNRAGRDEFRMRVRVIEQTLSALQSYGAVLSLRRHGLFAFQLISHKLLRYAVPVLLLGFYACNILLAGDSTFYFWFLVIQTAFYLLSVVGLAGRGIGVRGALTLPYYFILANAASLVAFIMYLRGQAHVVWEPIRESRSSRSTTGSN